MRSCSGTSIQATRRRTSSRVVSNSAFLREEAAEPVREDDEEDDRLLGRHGRAGELLVAERRQAPEPRRVLVEVVDRTRQQREQEPERRREDERRERVARARAALEPPRSVLHQRPPHEYSGREVARVLEMEQRALMTERGVVHRRHVPEEVAREPER